MTLPKSAYEVLTGLSLRKLKSFGDKMAGAKKRRKTNPLTAEYLAYGSSEERGKQPDK